MPKPPRDLLTAIANDMPAWAADWITTPPDEDPADQADELADEDIENGDAPSSARDVLVAVAGGALAGLAAYGVNRLIKRLAEGTVEQTSPRTGVPKRKAARAPTRPAPAMPRHAPATARAVPPSPRPSPFRAPRDARRSEAQGDDAKHAAAAQQRAEARRHARAVPPPPPNDDDIGDREAAVLLGVHVDASADQIRAALRRCVKQRMKSGDFHDQRGADAGSRDAALVISAKNRLLERARRRAKSERRT